MWPLTSGSRPESDNSVRVGSEHGACPEVIAAASSQQPPSAPPGSHVGTPQQRHSSSSARRGQPMKRPASSMGDSSQLGDPSTPSRTVGMLMKRPASSLTSSLQTGSTRRKRCCTPTSAGRTMSTALVTSRGEVRASTAAGSRTLPTVGNLDDDRDIGDVADETEVQHKPGPRMNGNGKRWTGIRPNLGMRVNRMGEAYEWRCPLCAFVARSEIRGATPRFTAEQAANMRVAGQKARHIAGTHRERSRELRLDLNWRKVCVKRLGPDDDAHWRCPCCDYGILEVDAMTSHPDGIKRAKQEHRVHSHPEVDIGSWRSLIYKRSNGSEASIRRRRTALLNSSAAAVVCAVREQSRHALIAYVHPFFRRSGAHAGKWTFTRRWACSACKKARRTPPDLEALPCRGMTVGERHLRRRAICALENNRLCGNPAQSGLTKEAIDRYVQEALVVLKNGVDIPEP